MAYSKNTWVDRVVQHASRYVLSLISGSTYDIAASPGTVTNAGTTITAAVMNNIENGIDAIYKGTHIYAASATGNDTYVVAFSPAYTAYNAGMIINIKPDTANTGAATINVDTLGAKDIKKMTIAGKVALTTGDIIANGIYFLIYDGTDFILVNPIAILASMFTAQGDIPYASAANTPSALAKGTARQQLAMNSGATAPEWVASLQSLITAAGDIIYGSAANTPAKLAKGTDGQVLQLSSGLPSWQTPTKTAYGSYVGNGASARDIPIGFSPFLVILSKSGASEMWIAVIGISNSLFIDVAPGADGGYCYINGSNLRVDVSEVSNNNLSTYYWVAFG